MRNKLADAVLWGPINRNDLRRLVNINNQHAALTPEMRADAASKLENEIKLAPSKIDREILDEYYQSLQVTTK